MMMLARIEMAWAVGCRVCHAHLVCMQTEAAGGGEREVVESRGERERELQRERRGEGQANETPWTDGRTE